MITQSFQLLKGVQRKTESNFRDQGITDWNDFITASSVKGISPNRKSYYNRKLLEAKKALFEDKLSYFVQHLPTSEHWRFWELYKDGCVYLDIETDGIDRYNDITVVGLYDGTHTKLMIKDINLDFKALKEELKKYKLLVTFNGTVFDVPFLEKRYPGVIPNIPHLDLRFACDKVGLNGGLKEVENKLGIRRNKIVEGLYGGDALALWRIYKNTGDEYYLNLLIEYNEEDIINLKRIASVVVDTLKKGI